MGEEKLYDLERIRAFSGGDESFLGQMIEIFLKNAPDQLKLITSNYDKGDYSQMAFYAHKLKSSIDNFNIEPLRTVVREIERIGKEKKDFSLLDENIQMLSTHLKKVLVQIKQDIS